MRSQIYTKAVEIAGGVIVRWFWRSPQGWRESPTGFISHAECLADAARNGLDVEDTDALWQLLSA
jgi:hypothetical protein